MPFSVFLVLKMLNLSLLSFLVKGNNKPGLEMLSLIAPVVEWYEKEAGWEQCLKNTYVCLGSGRDALIYVHMYIVRRYFAAQIRNFA